MMTHILKAMGILLGSVWLLILGTPIHADMLPPGMVIGDAEGISVDGTGEYYIQKEDLRPGDHFVKELQLMNTEENDRPYVLEMDVAPKEKKGEIDFYEAISVTMKLDGKLIYQGNLIGEGTPDIQQHRLPLGTYAYGDLANLEVSFDVSKEVPAAKWQTKSEAVIKWTFYATKEKAPDQPKVRPKNPSFLPQTGEEWRMLIYKVITGIFIVCVVLLVAKRRRNRETNN